MGTRNRIVVTMLAAATGFTMAGLAGCSSQKGADCTVVKLQRDAGRSDSEIAAALGSTEEAVGKCSESGAASSGGGSRYIPESY